MGDSRGGNEPISHSAPLTGGAATRMETEHDRTSLKRPPVRKQGMRQIVGNYFGGGVEWCHRKCKGRWVRELREGRNAKMIKTGENSFQTE